MRYARMSRSKIDILFKLYNEMTGSYQSFKKPIKEFNRLTVSRRKEVKSEFQKLENQKNKDLLKEVKALSVETMVNFQIVASMYEINSATVALCIDPPCKMNERILVVK
jgi:hypothetical protein